MPLITQFDLEGIRKAFEEIKAKNSFDDRMFAQLCFSIGWGYARRVMNVDGLMRLADETFASCETARKAVPVNTTGASILKKVKG